MVLGLIPGSVLTPGEIRGTYVVPGIESWSAITRQVPIYFLGPQRNLDLLSPKAISTY